MITTDKIKIGDNVYYYDNKANIIETTCESEVMNFKGEPSVHVLSQKTPVPLMYLYAEKPINVQPKGHVLVTGNPINQIEVAPPTEIVFKGKIAGELEETIITPELIDERSKPLLALTIKGLHDTEGAEAMKAAVLKAVRLRTSVEKLEEPILKSITAQAKKAKEAVTSVSKPIYDKCLEVQNALQAKLDAWQLQVNQAKAKEDAALKERTEAREAKMFSLGMLYNGVAFTGYGKTITKESLFALEQDRYDALIVELTGLKEEADLLPPTEAPVASAFLGTPMYHSAPTTALNGSVGANTATKRTTKFGGQEIVYLKLTSLGSIIITKGQVPADTEAEVLNDRILLSSYYLHLTK